VCDAGQAVVQMARHSRSGLEYAIKFFVTSTFYDEAAIYQDRSNGLGRHADRLKLPQVCPASMSDAATATVHSILSFHSR
jgi:hypothetical protein